MSRNRSHIVRACVIAPLLAAAVWAGYTSAGSAPLFKGGPIADGGVFDDAVNNSADVLVNAGCSAEGNQAKSLLDQGKICEELSDAANKKYLGSNYAWGSGINLNPALMLKAGMEQSGFTDPAVQGSSAILAGMLIHELYHFNAPPEDMENRRERPAYIAEFNKLCMLASQEDTPEGLKAICERLKVAQNNANNSSGNEAVPPDCEACAEVEGGDNDSGAPGLPPPPYVPSGAPGYGVSVAWQLRIDGIWVPPEYVPSSVAYHPRRQGIDIMEDNRLPSYSLFSKPSEIWVERWNEEVSPYGGPGDGSWEQKSVPLDFKGLAMTGDGPSRLFVAGRMANSNSIIREYTFLLNGLRLGFQVQDIYVGNQIDIITGIAYHAGANRLVVLDAAQDRLWSVDVSSGAAMLVADSGTVPPLDGCYSLHIVSESVTGAVYSLSYELLDTDSIDDSPGVLEIVDLDVTDTVLDSHLVYFP